MGPIYPAPKRILFVDDEEFIVSGLRRMLRRQRDEWDMHFVLSAEQALQCMSERPFDVIVTDMQMPGMNGAELLERVPGAQGAIIADWEGEAVDQVARIDDYELKVIGAHKGVILNNLRQVVRRLDGGSLEELVIATEKTQTLVLPLTEEYFLVLTLACGDALGRALFEARRCAACLKMEIV